MTFRWLPDPERYTHPHLSWLLQYAFDVVLGRMFRVDHDLPSGFRLPPGTLIVSNHLRDSDAPILGTLLYCREGVHMRGVLPFFAMREDLFQREAMANLLYACPWPLIHLLRLVPLRWLFGNVRTLPMRRVREFTWHDALREIVHIGLGACDPAEVFNARGVRELRSTLGTLPNRVDHINPWRMGALRVEVWGLRRLSLATLRKIAPDFRAAVDAQLKEMVCRLDAGHSLYFAPEGHISMDGSFGRIRAGTWRLGRATGEPLTMLPMTISYDPLGPGKTRSIVRMGQPLRDLDVHDTRKLARNVRQALIAGRVVTPSHLLAQFLSTHAAPFSARELADWLEQAKLAVQSAQLVLDPVFGHGSTQVLVAQRLDWLRRRRLVTCKLGAWQRRWDPSSPPGWLHASGMVRYLANAFADLAPGLARTLSA
ncbi:MAG TPA: hypothetical protein VF269_05720 [Rhodanobacteraceae bacterium]